MGIDKIGDTNTPDIKRQFDSSAESRKPEGNSFSDTLKGLKGAGGNLTAAQSTKKDHVLLQTALRIASNATTTREINGLASREAAVLDGKPQQGHIRL